MVRAGIPREPFCNRMFCHPQCRTCRIRRLAPPRHPVPQNVGKWADIINGCHLLYSIHAHAIVADHRPVQDSASRCCISVAPTSIRSAHHGACGGASILVANGRQYPACISRRQFGGCVIWRRFWGSRADDRGGVTGTKVAKNLPYGPARTCLFLRGSMD